MGYGAHGEKTCPRCRGILSYILEYDRFFCHKCGIYPEGVVGETPRPAVPVARVPQQPAARTEGPRAPRPSVGLPAPQQRSQPAAPRPPLQARPVPRTVAPPAPAVPLPREATREEEETPIRAPLRRSDILRSGKAELTDLCKTHDLDPTGTKEQLRVRLLSYLESLEDAGRSREPEPWRPPPGPLLPQPVERPTAPERPVTWREPARGASSASVVLLEERVAEPFVLKVEVTPATGLARKDVAYLEPAKAPEVPPLEAMPVPLRAVPRKALPPRPAEHPCPTCSRELEYISRYDRWFCHTCKRYAPTAAFKHACPSCGATLRWIERYGRWWCDACRTYAPKDLPAPVALAQIASAIRAPTRVEPAPRIPVRPGRNVGTGVALIAFGLGLWITYVALAEAPAAFSMPVLLGSDVAFVLRFAGLLFVALGTIFALLALRRRNPA